MNIRIGALCILAVAFVSALPDSASASWRNRGAAYGPVSQPVFGTAPATILPTAAEIMAVPRAQDGRLLAHPVDIVRYPLNLHPGLRTLRIMRSGRAR